jgi:hypothetical protein
VALFCSLSPSRNNSRLALFCLCALSPFSSLACENSIYNVYLGFYISAMNLLNRDKDKAKLVPPVPPASVGSLSHEAKFGLLGLLALSLPYDDHAAPRGRLVMVAACCSIWRGYPSLRATDDIHSWRANICGGWGCALLLLYLQLEPPLYGVRKRGTRVEEELG